MLYPETPWERATTLSSDKKNERLIFAPNTGFGWHVEKDLPLHPVLKIGGDQTVLPQCWIPVRRMIDPRGAHYRLETEIFKHLARLASHDVNGKMMGLEGMVSYWEEKPIGVTAAVEDLRMIKSSLVAIQKITTTLGWLGKDHPDDIFVFSMEKVHEAWNSLLPRIIRPAQQVHLADPSKDQTIFSSPAMLIFWLFSTMLTLAALKEQGETLELSLSSSLGPNDVSRLHIQTNCRKLYQLLASSQMPDVISPTVWDWFTVFALHDGSISVDTMHSMLTLVFPMTPFTSNDQPTDLVFGAKKGDSLPSGAQAVPDLGIESVIHALGAHLFKVDQIWLDDQVSEDYRKAIESMARSIRGIRMLSYTNKVS